MPSNDNTETITRFTHAGVAYELDHLGICRPDQAGTFAVYRDGDQVAEFGSEWEIPPPGEPITDELMAALIEEAVAALTDQDSEASHV